MKKKLWLSLGLIITSALIGLGTPNVAKAATEHRSITIIDAKNGTSTEIDASKKLFYNYNQVKKGFFEDSTNSRRQVYQWDITPPTIIFDAFGILDRDGSDENPYAIKATTQTISGQIIDTESGVDIQTVNGIIIF